jgi:hypothetical protein
MLFSNKYFFKIIEIYLKDRLPPTNIFYMYGLEINLTLNLMINEPKYKIFVTILRRFNKMYILI